MVAEGGLAVQLLQAVLCRRAQEVLKLQGMNGQPADLPHTHRAKDEVLSGRTRGDGQGQRARRKVWQKQVIGGARKSQSEIKTAKETQALARQRERANYRLQRPPVKG